MEVREVIERLAVQQQANEVVAVDVHGGAKWCDLKLDEHQKQKTLRYNELQRAVDGISRRMLTLSLKKLEENGFVKRTIFPFVPPRVDYELSPLGRTLVEPLGALLDWTLENRAAMAEARRAYARASNEARLSST